MPANIINSALTESCERFARFSALAVTTLGTAVLLGWALDIAILQTVLPGLASMKTNTALGFLLSGVSLAAACRIKQPGKWHPVQLLAAGMVTLLGLLTLGEFLFAADFGIDRLFFSAAPEPMSTAGQGRMSLATALAFAFSGLALLLLDNRHARALSRTSALIAGLIGFLAIIGYLYSVQALYGVVAYSSMALHTAVGFLLVNLGIIFARPTRGLMAVMTSNSSGGMMSRRLLPLVFTAPLLIGWLHLQGKQRGLYSYEFGDALLVIVYVLLFSLLVWRTAKVLHSTDHLRFTAEQERNQQRRQLSGIINSAMDAIISVDEAHRVILFNPAAERMFGYTSAEIIGEPLERLIPEQFRQTHGEHMRRFAAGGVTNRSMASQNELLALRADGTEFPIEASISNIRISDQQIFTVILRDVSKRHEMVVALRSSEERFRSLVEQASDGIFVSDIQGRINEINSTGCAMLGYTHDELLKLTIANLIEPADIPRLEPELGRLNNGAMAVSEWHFIRKDGTSFLGEIRARQLENGSIQSILIDITERKSAEDEIRSLAFYDPLTRLPNRRLLTDRLKHALTNRTRGGKHSGALLFIDLDHFKNLNDTLGHDIGDLLLQQVAVRLQSCVRETDTVARFGGDEFVILLENLSINTLEAAAETKVVGKKILTVLNQPYQLAEHKYHNTPSIGATLFNDKQIESDEMLKQADIALYQSKKSGRNALRFFDPKMQHTVNARADLESELRNAIEQQQFQLYYQIQVNNSHQAIGAEALIRWNHPERGLIFPAAFIPLANETGLILPIGSWVMETACAQLKRWQQDTLTRELVLAVNVSAVRFRQTNFVAQVTEIVERHAINPARLKLELTESMLLDNIEETISAMNALNKIGIQFSLDDFGTGYSSLQYLKRLPLDQLKIDQSFVDDIATNSNDRAIVRTIIAMARSMDMDIIAEGVENEEQKHVLLNKGCKHFQGNLFGEPLPVWQFEALLSHQ